MDRLADCQAERPAATNGDQRALCLFVAVQHFGQQEIQRQAFGGVQVAVRALGDLLGKRFHLRNQFLPDGRQIDDDLAAVDRVVVHLDQFALLQPVNHAAHGGLVDDGGLDQIGQRAGAVVPHRTQHDELRGGELGIGYVLLEEGGMPLIDPPQQVTYLIRKQIAILGGRGLAFHIAHKPI